LKHISYVDISLNRTFVMVLQVRFKSICITPINYFHPP